MPLTEDQLRLRRKHLTGTDMAAIAGLSAYRSPIAVWADKTGRASPEPVNAHMQRGITFEPIIRDAYAAEAGAEVTEPGTVVSPDDDLFCATPDGIATLPSGEQVCLEIKAPHPRNAYLWGEPGTDQIPMVYVPQVMAQMACTRLLSTHVVAWMGEGLLHYEVPFDAQLWADMAGMGRAFWERYVVTDTMPPVDGSESWTNQLKAMHPTNRLHALRRGDSAAEAQVQRILQAREVIREAEGVVDEAKNRLKAFIGDHDGANGDGWLVSWKQNRSSAVTDWRAVAVAAGAGEGLIAEHTRDRPGARPFLVKASRPVPDQQKAIDTARGVLDRLTAANALYRGAL